jgi:hypothetical protein
MRLHIKLSKFWFIDLYNDWSWGYNEFIGHSFMPNMKIWHRGFITICCVLNEGK